MVPPSEPDVLEYEEFWCSRFERRPDVRFCGVVAAVDETGSNREARRTQSAARRRTMPGIWSATKPIVLETAAARSFSIVAVVGDGLKGCAARTG
jgi:hypothetical protein